MNIQDAQTLREEQKRLMVKLNELKQIRESLSRSEKIQNIKNTKQYQKELDRISEMLKDAPPEPLNPHTALRNLRKFFLAYIQTYKTHKQKVLFDMNKPFSICRTLEWNLQDLCANEEKAKIAYQFLSASYQKENDIDNLFHTHICVDEWIERTTEELISDVKFGLGNRSSSMSHNAVNEATHSGIAEMLDHFRRYRWQQYKEELEQVKLWIELKLFEEA